MGDLARINASATEPNYSETKKLKGAKSNPWVSQIYVCSPHFIHLDILILHHPSQAQKVKIVLETILNLMNKST